MNKIALITGATSGFGEACARRFASHQYDLIITGRREERLTKLQSELQEKFKVKVLALRFDVQVKDEVFHTIEKIPEPWQNIDVLINNAGLAIGRDSFEDADLNDWEVMMNTNVKGLVYVSKAVLPFMIRRKKGQIINIGSVAGKEVYEKGNMYCATKFSVDALTKSMRIDLLKHNIKVTGIHPGAADTEFSSVRFKGDEETARKIYEGYQPLSADDVADVIYYCSSLPDHVCINDLVLTCTAQANAFYTYKKV